MRKPHTTLTDAFHNFAKQLAADVGSPWVFLAALLIVVVWSATGPLFRYSDTWQLVINTGTTIVTFLMVFLIQNTQNRDSEALHLKIDELLRALDAADTRLVDLEERSEQELEQLRKRYKDLASDPALEGQVEADFPSQSASGSRASQRSRNQSLRRRVQNAQT
jgi:low affinity Fe/Cu permease